jgi:hypothetical protein
MSYEDTGIFRQIERHLNRIANVMEAREKRAREQTLNQVLDAGTGNVDMAVLWQTDVVRGDTVLGFSEWLAWRNQDQIEAAQAVKRGFADLEQQVKGEGDA